MFTWGNGRLGKFSAWHKDYKFVIKDPLRWIGGLTLKTRLEVIDKLTLGVWAQAIYSVAVISLRLLLRRQKHLMRKIRNIRI